MKFTALMATRTTTIVVPRLRLAEPMVSPPIGKVMSWTPFQAMTPAASTCPASLVIQSSSHRSSMTPRRHTSPAPRTTAQALEFMTPAR